MWTYFNYKIIQFAIHYKEKHVKISELTVGERKAKMQSPKLSLITAQTIFKIKLHIYEYTDEHKF